jgi:hypothetical protein
MEEIRGEEDPQPEDQIECGIAGKVILPLFLDISI